MIALAVAFVFGMATVAPKSNDPAGMMRTVGQVSGAVGGLGVATILIGLLKRRG